MSKKRAFVIAFVAGLYSLLVSAAFDGAWPDYGATKWLVLIGGWVVIAVLAIAIERAVRANTASRATSENPELQ